MFLPPCWSTDSALHGRLYLVGNFPPFKVNKDYRRLTSRRAAVSEKWNWLIAAAGPFFFYRSQVGRIVPRKHCNEIYSTCVAFHRCRAAVVACVGARGTSEPSTLIKSGLKLSNLGHLAQVAGGIKKTSQSWKNGCYVWGLLSHVCVCDGVCLPSVLVS